MPITVSLDTGRPKSDILEMAFEDCGLSGYEFGRTPEEITAALRKLNAMMDEWPWSLMGYVQPEYSSGSPEEASGIPRKYTSVVAQYLALRIAPNMGKTLSVEQRATLSRSYSLMQSELATVPSMPYPNSTMRGLGSKPQNRPFMTEGVVVE